MRFGPLSLLFLAAASPAIAQDEIVVTGRGLADAPGDATLSVVEVGVARLTATASGRLEDALKDVGGLQQFRRTDARSANPTSQGATLRGLGGNAAARALVLLDGVPQGDPFAGYVSWPRYLPERLGRVRVTRGGGSGAGGSGALAGTIELDSIGAADASALSGTVSGGSHGAAEARAMATARLGQGFALIAGGYSRGDGFVPVVSPGPVDRGARYDQGSVDARAVVPLGGGELHASLGLFDDVRTRGTDFSRNSTSGADASLRYVARDALVLGYVQTRHFTSQFPAIDAARATVTPTLDQYNTPATGAGLKAEYRPRLGKTELRLGAEWRRTAGETREAFFFQNGIATRLRAAGGASDIIGAFGEATHAFGPLTLTGGGRVDYWTLTDGSLREATTAGSSLTDTRYPDRRGVEATGRLGVALALTPALDLRAAAYLGWRLPTLNELYRPFRVGAEVTAANAALVPERSRGSEVGIAWRPAEGMSFGLTVFDMRLSGAIANVTLSGTQRQRQNVDAVTSRGFEFDASYAHVDWRIAASAAFSDARARGAALDGLRPASVAPFQASGTLGWRGFSATARYVSAQFDDDLNARRLAPALTVDAVAEMPLGRGFAVRGRIENAFDARVEAARSTTGVVERASPRTIWIGLRFEK